MTDKYEFYRGFAMIVFKHHSGVTDTAELLQKELHSIACSSVIKRILRQAYEKLVAHKDMISISDQPKDYQRELWEEAKRHLPEADTNERMDFCKSFSAYLWFLNN